MSWSLASAEVVSIVGDVTPTLKSRASPSKFRHRPEIPDGHIGQARCFRLRLVGGHGVGPLMPSAQTLRTRAEVALEVFYPVDFEPEEQDAIIAQDYADIRSDLLTDTNWNRPTSTIEIVAAGSGVSIMPFRIERTPQGAKLILPFSLEYRG